MLGCSRNSHVVCSQRPPPKLNSPTAARPVGRFGAQRGGSGGLGAGAGAGAGGAGAGGGAGAESGMNFAERMMAKMGHKEGMGEQPLRMTNKLCTYICCRPH